MKRVLPTISFVFCISLFANAQVINTVAGDGSSGYNGDGIPATTAKLNDPFGVAVDSANNFYIADARNNRIRMVNATSGLISTISGIDTLGFSGDGGPATAAELDGAWGVMVDADGDIYIADSYNGRIRMINTSGIINTVAGSGGGYYNGDSIPATAANLYTPNYVTKDKAGNLYISDADNERVRMVNTSGIIFTIAGSAQYGAYGGDGGPATAAELNQPNGIAFDTSGNLYFADELNNIVRKVDKLTGIITTVAGNYSFGAGFSGNGGPATAAELYWPSGLAFDSANNMYISGGRLIREVSGSTGLIYTVAGNPNYFISTGDGGPATAAHMDPWNIALTKNGYILSDNGNSRIREVTGWANLCLFSLNPIVTTHIPCYGNTNGTVIANPTSGASFYTYFWSPGNQTTDTATGLSAGTYTITTGNLGCTATASVIITQPNILTVSANNINISCYNSNNGSASSSVSGGTSPYTYLWSNANSNTSISYLSIGTYTITVYDSCGGSATAFIVITQPDMLTVSVIGINISCFNSNNGGALSTVSGGAPPYTYSWSAGGSNSSISNLSAGIYALNITDNNGCTASAGVSISQPTVIIPIITQYSGITCYGDSGAVVFANASGGTGFYQYQWSDVLSQSNAIATGLSVGTYTVTVTDNTGCSGTSNTTITQPPALNIISSTTADNGTCNGSAWVQASGGTPSYSYLWTGGLTTDSIINKCAGYYCCTVTDANGCIDSICATISTFTGTSELRTNNKELRVYPDPNNGNFTVELGHAQTVLTVQPTIEIYNALGEKIYGATLKQVQGYNMIDLSSQPNGIYLCRVITENGKLIGERRMVIQK